MNKDCIFCKIIKGEIPSEKYYEDDDIIAIKNIYPIAPVHALIIPKKHIKNLTEIDEKDINLLGKIQFVASMLAKKLDIFDGFRISNANEEKGGQTVFHMHYHLIGGWKEKQTFES
jgi:histidine triad (HIT) family protein